MVKNQKGRDTSIDRPSFCAAPESLNDLFRRIYNQKPHGCGALCHGNYGLGFPRGMRGSTEERGLFIILFNPAGNQAKEWEINARKQCQAQNNVVGSELFSIYTRRLQDRENISSNNNTGRKIHLLYTLLSENGLPVYLTNAVKCQSSTAAAIMTDKKLTAKTCVHTFLREEIHLLKPKLLVVLGKDALRLLISDPDVRKEVYHSPLPKRVETLAGSVPVFYFSHPASRLGNWSQQNLPLLAQKLEALYSSI
ncbi:MAG TPA: uracil-DNA glycosylase family protein [Burkholderiales bacterium]|nr:uracil-DNA glycosylase family protein [Burkholderiales bacterium]